MTNVGEQNQGSEHLYLPAVFALLVGLQVCLSPTVLCDGDTFTHIAAGGWMIDHWSVLRTDPFSATFVGQKWNAHEWLSEVLLAVSYRADGLTGVLLLTAAAAAVAFANLARHVGATAGQRATMILTGAAVVCVMPSLLARPHILALPLLEIWVAELLAARQARRVPGWWLLAVIAVWANMHGGFAFGLAIGAALAIEASLHNGGGPLNAWRWWVFLAGAFGAGLLTPQGWDGLLFPFRLLQLRSLSAIDEWQPVNFAHDYGFEAVLLAVMAVLGTGRVKVPWFRLVLLLGLMHLSLAHARHSVLFGIAGALILAEPVGQAFVDRRRAERRAIGRGLCWGGVVLMVVLRLASPVGTNDSRAAPVSALAQVPLALSAAPVLNSYQFGGYLELVGLHPFIDGRLELFGDAFVTEFQAMARPDGERLREGIEQYGIKWAILAREDPLVAGFDRLTGWKRKFSDGTAVVFVRG